MTYLVGFVLFVDVETILRIYFAPVLKTILSLYKLVNINNMSKRVVAFFDMYDEIPEKGKYLYSKSIEVPVVKKNNNLLTEEAIVSQDSSKSLYIHYYEIDHMDFEELISSKFNEKTMEEKISEFIKKYNN